MGEILNPGQLDAGEVAPCTSTAPSASACYKEHASREMRRGTPNEITSSGDQTAKMVLLNKLVCQTEASIDGSPRSSLPHPTPPPFFPKDKISGLPTPSVACTPQAIHYSSPQEPSAPCFGPCNLGHMQQRQMHLRALRSVSLLCTTLEDLYKWQGTKLDFSASQDTLPL